MAYETDLKRFVDAQRDDYETALSEIKSGRKRSHWMWYIFPQILGLGFSSTSKFYAIKDRDEAVAYLCHPILGERLISISKELLKAPTDNANAIFEEMKKEGIEPVIIGTSVEGFSVIVTNNVKLQQLIQKYQSDVAAQQKYYSTPIN